MKQITQSEAEALFAQSEKPVFIDFFATWCGPCKMLAPVLETVSPRYPDVEFVKVDVDEEPALAAKFGVRVIPTLVIVKNGEPVATATGYRDAEQLAAFIDGAI